MYARRYMRDGKNLWELASEVDVLLLNGERFLDFPRPLPLGITFMGAIGEESTNPKNLSLPAEIESIYGKRNSKGVIIFSLGTVSNTSNMPIGMMDHFFEAFTRFPEYEFLLKVEISLPKKFQHVTNIHVRRVNYASNMNDEFSARSGSLRRH